MITSIPLSDIVTLVCQQLKMFNINDNEIALINANWGGD
jgi:hypothetical protein